MVRSIWRQALRLCHSSAWWSDVWRFVRDYGVCFLPIVLLGYITFESYQIDFRSMYLAGKSVVLGLDPYVNYVGVRADFYGPINSESNAYSGFRYPPLAAIAFVPLGMLPYESAKLWFTVAMLAAVVLLISHFVKASGFSVPESAVLFIMFSFPVIAAVERGQVDAVIVCFSVFSYSLTVRQSSSRSSSGAAFLLAIAGMLKLFPFFLLIFYGVRRQWRFVGTTLAYAAVLFALPYPFLVRSSYGNFFRRSLPEHFGQIATGLPTDLQGQGVIDRMVHSVDSTNLLAAHSLSSGGMNPWMMDNTLGAVICGLVLSGLLFVAMHRTPLDFQFYAFLNTINLFNPVSWIMGLIWYVPLFLYLSRFVSRLGLFLLLAPLFSPPLLGANAVLAYVIAIVFALSFRMRSWGSLFYLSERLNPPVSNQSALATPTR